MGLLVNMMVLVEVFLQDTMKRCVISRDVSLGSFVELVRSYNGHSSRKVGLV